MQQIFILFVNIHRCEKMDKYISKYNINIMIKCKEFEQAQVLLGWRYEQHSVHFYLSTKWMNHP